MPRAFREGFWERIGEPCPERTGTRIRLVEMTNDPHPIAAGEMGVVMGGNGAQVWVAFDNGASLALLVGQDKWEVVS